MFDMDFNKSNIGNLEKGNLDNFSLDRYSDKVNEEKFKAKISPKQNIQNIKENTQKLIAYLIPYSIYDIYT